MHSLDAAQTNLVLWCCADLNSDFSEAPLARREHSSDTWRCECRSREFREIPYVSGVFYADSHFPLLQKDLTRNDLHTPSTLCIAGAGCRSPRASD